MKTAQHNSAADATAQVDWLELVRQQVASLRFGVVQIVVHDSRVIQVEKTERLRLEQPQRLDAHQKTGGSQP